MTRSSMENAEPVWSGSPKVTVNTTSLSVNDAAVGTTETLGRVVSNAPETVPTVFGLPGRSVADPAGTVTVKLPSATRERVNVNVRPSPTARKSPTATEPVVWSEAAVKPLTASENETI